MTTCLCHRPRLPRIFLWALLALILSGCTAARLSAGDAADAAAAADKVIRLAGVDSTTLQAAMALAGGAFVDRKRQEAAAALADEGRALTQEADSLLAAIQSTMPAYLDEPVGPDTTSASGQEAAVEAFNRGARALKRYAEADSLHAASLLEEAQTRFEEALSLNPFDEEARYWLARVYSLRARRLGVAGEHEHAFLLLLRLSRMKQDDHVLFAALAESAEHLHRWTHAAAFWQKAAGAARDDEALDPEGTHRADSSLIFGYYVRSERAYVEAGSSSLALRALREAEAWTHAEDELALLAEEHAWLRWDEGNITTRKTFDRLLGVSQEDPGTAAWGMEALLRQVTSRQARGEVRHRLGLLYYELGEPGRAAAALQALWHDLARRDGSAPDDSSLARRVREDYGAVTYLLARESYRQGDLRTALAYLLQSEQTGCRLAGRAALEAALLLGANVSAALEAARRAERRMAELAPEERRRLLRYMVELHRRRGDRREAMRYLEAYRRLAGQP